MDSVVATEIGISLQQRLAVQAICFADPATEQHSVHSMPAFAFRYIYHHLHGSDAWRESCAERLCQLAAGEPSVDKSQREIVDAFALSEQLLHERAVTQPVALGKAPVAHPREGWVLIRHGFHAAKLLNFGQPLSTWRYKKDFSLWKK